MRLTDILITLTLLLTANPAIAEIVISGHVVNDDNEPVDVATTKLVGDNGKILNFQITDENGYFEYIIDGDMPEASLVVECLGYETFKRDVADGNDLSDMRIILHSKATDLKEVVVAAPTVTLRGDTISYRLSAFTGKGDVTLKDAMRNLPGIDISDNGKIKYMGKEISDFYIEGMDLLGGKYNVATDNLPADKVSNVEILNNHQSVKMNDDIFSDNVAINIKLSSKAKFRPIGTYEVKGGYDDDWLYQVSGAGMMFNNKFQSILNAKYGNVEEFAENANADHYFKENDRPYTASKLLGDLGLSTPPLERDRFITPQDCFVTLNMLKKTGEEATFRANTGYSYTRTSYDYLSLKDYHSDEGVVHISQQQSSLTKAHKHSLSLEYKLNSSHRHLTNTLTGNAEIKDMEVPSVLDGLRFGQQERVRNFLIANDFSMSWRRNSLRWNLTSTVEYGATPKGCLRVTDSDAANSFIQEAQSHFFMTKETLSTAYERGYSRLWLPLSLLYSNNDIESRLNNPGARNDMADNNLRIWLAPQYEYTHPMRKYVFRASANLKWEYNHVINRGSEPIRKTDSRFDVSPIIYFNWMMTPSSTLRSQISYLNRVGDAGDFLTAAVRTDNLNISFQSGLLSHQKSLNAMLHYDFKLPLDMWFVNADMIYDNSRSNLITNSNIYGLSIEVSSLPYPKKLENLTAFLNLTKIVSSIKTKFSLGGSYMWARGDVSQNMDIFRQYGETYSVMAKIVSRPWSFIELDYAGNLTFNNMRYNSISSTLRSHNHNIKLNLFPFKGFQIKMGADIIGKQISEDVSKTFTLLDVGVSYKFSYFRIGADLNNILNTRHYSYTIFSGINRFSYDYTLRGREFLISFSFTR